jgi:hypothetical protein
LTQNDCPLLGDLLLQVHASAAHKATSSGAAASDAALLDFLRQHGSLAHLGALQRLAASGHVAARPAMSNVTYTAPSTRQLHSTDPAAATAKLGTQQANARASRAKVDASLAAEVEALKGL